MSDVVRTDISLMEGTSHESIESLKEAEEENSRQQNSFIPSAKLSLKNLVEMSCPLPFEHEKSSEYSGMESDNNRNKITNSSYDLEKLNIVGNSENANVISHTITSEEHNIPIKESDDCIHESGKEPRCDYAAAVIKQETVLKIESIKDEFCEGQTIDDSSEIQQTRNLFETVGLTLKASSHAQQQQSSHAQQQQSSHAQQQQSSHAQQQQSSHAQQQQSSYDVPNEELNVTGQVSETHVQNSVDFPTVSMTAEGKPSVCHFCGFPAPSPEIYMKHMVHHDRSNGKYNCFLCNHRMFHKNRENGIKHYREAHNIGEQDLLKCGNCLYVSSDEKGYQDHMRQHFIIRPHACQICYTTFTSSHYLDYHMAHKHSEEHHKKISVALATSPQVVLLKKRRGRPPVIRTDALNKAVKKRKKSKIIKSDQLSQTVCASNASISPNTTISTYDTKSQYHVLPTKAIVLQCSFCGIPTKDKTNLAEHLLSAHGTENVFLKPFFISGYLSSMGEL